MTGQDAQVCTTCRTDPSTAPGRVCAPRRCYCAHETCPAYPSWVPREGQARVIHLPEPRTTSSAWANREESTWIDKL